jgi:hypothetical protein
MGTNILLSSCQPAASPDSQCSGGGDFRALGSQCPSPPVVPVAPVSPVSCLLGPSSLSCPPGFPSAGAVSPSDPSGPLEVREGCGAFGVLFPASLQRTPLIPRTRAPTWRLRSGSGHGWLARYRWALIGPERWPALSSKGQKPRASGGRD